MTRDTQDWEAGTQYGLGSRVFYKGREYTIVQPHRSQGDWAPDVVPALWAQVSGGGQASHEHEHEHEYELKHKHDHDQKNQSCDQQLPQYQQTPLQSQQQPYQQQPSQQEPYQMVPPAPQQQQQPNYGSIPTQQVVPPNSNDPRKQEHDGFHIGKLSFSEDALKIGGGILGTAAALGIGAFAYDKYKDAQEEKGDGSWLSDARRRQGEYLERIKADAHLPPVTWVLSEGSAIPQGAVQGGQDTEGRPYYIGRCFHKNGIYIGKVSKELKDGCHIGYHGKEVVVFHYEILLGYTSAVRWVDGVGKLSENTPDKLVEGGRTETGVPISVGQTHVRDGSVIPGGVSTEAEGCHVAFEDDEKVVRDYRFLVYAA